MRGVVFLLMIMFGLSSGASQEQMQTSGQDQLQTQTQTQTQLQRQRLTYSTRTYTTPRATGVKRDPVKLRRFLSAVRKHKYFAALVPGHFDLSPQVSSPEDQGQCGSCWAFSLTKAMRSAHMLVGADPGRIAFNYLLNNCGPVQEFGCGGGDFEAGKNFLNLLGPWLESQDPYTQRQGSCKNFAVASTALDIVALGDGNNPPTFQQLAQAISLNHMLSIDVAVCGDWANYSGGIFDRNECGAGSINHMINLNGYDCESSVDKDGHCVFNSQGQPVKGDGYLIVMNNWGNWGENGYMRTRWGVDALATTAIYFDVKLPVPPVPPVPPPPPVPPIPPIPPTPPEPVAKCHGFLCGVFCFLPWCD